MSFFLRAQKHDFSGPLALPRCGYMIDSYSWHAIGGPERATIIAEGSELDLWALLPLLRCPITIRHAVLGATWWGYIASIELPTPTHTITVGVDTVNNRILAEYTEPGPRGTVAATTPWINDLESIARFGIKETKLSLGDSTQATALQYVNQVLAARGRPVRMPRAGSGTARQAKITCLGWWSTTHWLHYEQPAGVVAYTDAPQARTGYYRFGQVTDLYRVAQSLVNTSGKTWQATHVSLAIKKDGAPTDDIAVSLRADTTNQPGAVLATATIPNSAIGSGGYLQVALSTPVSLTPNTRYWIACGRTGAVDFDHCYQILVDFNEIGGGPDGYPAGEMADGNGTTWTIMSNKDVLFRVTGTAETSEQIRWALSFPYGDLFTGVDIATASGIATSPYRTGDARIQDELTEWLRQGTSGGVRYLATVTEQRVVKIFPEPGATAPRYRQDPTGRLITPWGTLLHEALCPVGIGVQVSDLAAGMGQGLLGTAPRYLIGRHEYRPSSNQRQIEPLDDRSVWQVGGIRA